MILCLFLFKQHWLQHIIDLLGRRILAVASADAGEQDELLHSFADSSVYEVDIALRMWAGIQQ